MPEVLLTLAAYVVALGERDARLAFASGCKLAAALRAASAFFAFAVGLPPAPLGGEIRAGGCLVLRLEFQSDARAASAVWRLRRQRADGRHLSRVTPG